MNKPVFLCLHCRGSLLERGSDALQCPACGAVYPVLEHRAPVLLPTDKELAALGISSQESASLSAVQHTYDRAYRHHGLMGTDLDEGYDQTTKKSLLSFAAPLDGKRVLDVGTGVGKLWDYVPCPVEAYALDLSPVGVLSAIDRHPHVTASVAIAEFLPFEDGFFDLAVAADTIEHTFSPERTVAEIYRVLKPGGVFAGSFPIPDSLRKWGWNTFVRTRPDVRMLGKLAWVVAKRIVLFGSPNFQPFDRDLTKEEWMRMIERTGFQLQVFKMWPESPKIPITYLAKAVKEDSDG